MLGAHDIVDVAGVELDGFRGDQDDVGVGGVVGLARRRI
jgi:hypothetical protein